MIIIGAGTAGLTAAIDGIREGGKVLLLEGDSYGGQITSTPEIDNYPGLPGISGFDFATKLFEQAESLGAEIEYEKVTGIRDQGTTKLVTTEDGTYEGKTVVIATGAKSRPLGVEREDVLTGKGVSYCATCDGAFFKNKVTAVVGGGNTALEEALFLSAICEKVYLVHRRDSFRGEEKMAGQLREKSNVEFVLSSRVSKLIGEGHLEEIEVENLETKATRILPVKGMFVAVGQKPDNQVFADLVQLDPAGYVIAGENCETNVPGIFAAGDCRTKTVRQLTTATADGAAAAVGAGKIFR